MVNVVIAGLLLIGQICLYRVLEPALVRMVGRRRARGAHYGLFAVQMLALAVVSLDNNWPISRHWSEPGPFGRAVALGAGVWIAGWSGAAVLLLAGRLLTRGRRPAAPATGGSSRRQFLLTAGRAAAVVAPFGVASYAVLFNRTNFELRDIAFPVRNLPAGLAGLRIALLTDLHFGVYLSAPELNRAIDMANEARPHLTLVTGDFITRTGDPLDACLAQLRRLRAEIGVFGCLGNHEIYADCEDYAEAQCRRQGIEILRRRAHTLDVGGAPLNLAGVDYQSRRRGRYLAGAERLVRPGAVNLLMSHNPDVFPVAADLGYDLVVGGHTHGGQVTVEILEQSANISRFFTPFVAGLYRRGSSALYVSRGIGTINLPLRLGARPEVSLLRLTSA
jgi:hypothetical protein